MKNQAAIINAIKEVSNDLNISFALALAKVKETAINAGNDKLAEQLRQFGINNIDYILSA